ncbi:MULTISPECIES: enoyl-CoA hydratase [Bacillaceae]|uniref:Enoyl-CoA hydratase n=1 Tax=Bacillus infantis TaxID=324767 RepID=A0A5D4SJF0_9BACI|nr:MULTISPECIES: enoyl-CoA hydratase [Bacillus]OXT17319.1 enoyl-CoA hydratase [Bacillus sp. OG2]MDT0159744.1 enoyl-CoA hydratase [Bacillus sp. AG4(2022)]MDW2877597.1 enoyl-CoA hydratase [Bacillus infantis]RYI32457.1 enoyl-CoA hydratase [Bacillus infantis]TYS62831.1 enoyl-CoA hydratase [Bacillus infantis]
MGNYVHIHFENKTAVLTIMNPPLNVLSKKVFQELGEAFESLRTNDGVVAVLLTGSGDKAFVAGADIKEFPEMMSNPRMIDEVMSTHEVLNSIDQFPKPVIAVLNGLTFGGGCELALACDIRIAEEHAQIGLPEIKLGLFPGGGGTQRLPRLIGEAKAKELMYTGEPVSAEEAARIGLVNKVAASGEGMQSARELAAKIAGHSLQALSRIKQAVDGGLDRTLEEGVKLEARLFEEVFRTEDIKEGVKAFIEKRKAEFKHR